MKNQYPRTPQQFLNGIYLKPYNFNDPQNPDHAVYVHEQLRNDLYNEALEKISNIEFEMFSQKQEAIKLDEIKQCKGEDYWLSKILNTNKHFKKDIQQNILSCQDWKIIKKKENKPLEISIYRVKCIQTSSDIFYTQVYPQTFWKQIKNFFIHK